ncbi:hypothetical protein P280DRAFT_279568 [Massarina eburnea CBS 473.64]|uniref:INO80 complex subunit F domain-containing protein n=1 Tax=Massarina eburnea CBS 473.64 TaxID=1395130 RepID=A0A6A6RGF9_9PLEO|nr:hypothetical protein P280DRAFT_279568 [Massarina eburnea CBS 473.64]
MPQPVPQQQPVRAFAQKDLPPSVEAAYYRKCIDLRRRIRDVEDSNDGTRLRIQRLQRGVVKMRLERAFLLEQLHKHMEYNVDDSDRSSSPPPTPTDKPLRSKRSHRKGTPPPGSQLGPGMANVQHASPGSVHHQQTLQPMNAMSSAQSTPDPSRSAPFFSATGGSAASPHAVNGNAPQALPPLHSLQPLPPQRETPRGTYFDPTQTEPQAADAENDAEHAGRRRAHSGAAAPPPEGQEALNGDTEMTDASGAGFTAVNPR